MNTDRDASSMPIKVLVLGGYGGVGKHIVEHLLKHFDFGVTIGGRNERKALVLKEELSIKYHAPRMNTVHVDATKKQSLIINFKKVDLVIVAATVPDRMALIAEAALECDVDLIDILVRSDVVNTLSKLAPQITEKKRVVITQCGFHPGIIAPLIRMAKPYFEEYNNAEVMMAMEGVFEQPAATKEILYEVIKSNALLLVEKKWIKANYKNAITFDFGEHFGEKECYPTHMKEVYNTAKQLRLSNCGVYSAGFDRYIDQFVLPLTVALGFLSRKLSLTIGSRLFFNRIKDKPKNQARAKLCLAASGRNNGKEKEVNISLSTDNSFLLTAITVVALLNQYLNNLKKQPGLYLMGESVNEQWMFQDLESMGIRLQVEVND